MEHKSLTISYTERPETELEPQWQQLVASAKEATLGAYAPYSQFYVGAAVPLEGGEVVCGSNQENAAFGAGTCAERTALFYAHVRYPGRAVRAIAIAARKGIRVMHGVYVGTTGPTFETPAEYEYFRIIGGDAVGMSTVPEVIVARHMDMRVFGVSVITDLGGKDITEVPSHEEVTKAAENAQPTMLAVIKDLVAEC